MKTEMNYLEINKKTWNSRVASHVNSEFYSVDAFLRGEDPLNDVEINLLGDIKGKSILHLQCHFGLDSLALARKGAIVTGIDFSETAISKATELAQEAKLNATFVCTDVYTVPNAIDEQFDVVFTSYGTIGWLPDLRAWAAVVSKMLKQGGIFVMVDFHPALWMMDNHFERIEYSYFKADPIVEEETGSYASKDNTDVNTTIGWNHSFGEILGSLINAGLELQLFQEYDYSPYPCFNNLEKIGHRAYQISNLKGKLPMMYSILASKK